MTAAADRSPLFTGRHSIAIPCGPTADSTIYCDLSLSTVTIPRQVGANLGEAIGVLQYPLIIAGHYITTTIPHTLRVLASAAHRALESLPSTAVAEIASTLVAIETAARNLCDMFTPVVETVIRWNTGELLSDPGLIEWYASNYARDNSAVTESSIEDSCKALTQASKPPYPATTVGEILRSLTADYDAGWARTVARVALNPPLPSAPLDLSQQASERLDPQDRFQRLATCVHRLHGEPDSTDVSQRRSRLIDECELEVRESGHHKGLDPLLEIPHSRAVESNHSQSPHESSLIGSPSGLAWLLDVCFTTGGFGCVVYPSPDSGGKWLVNPQVSRSTVSGDTTYRESIATAIVVDHILSRLFDCAERGSAGRTEADNTIACPLCNLTTGTCGSDGCRYEQLLAGCTERFSELTTNIADEIASLSATESALFD